MYPARAARSNGDEPSDQKCHGLFCTDISLEWVAAAALSWLFSYNGAWPELERSAFIESSTRNWILAVSEDLIRYTVGSGCPSEPIVGGGGAHAAKTTIDAIINAVARIILPPFQFDFTLRPFAKTAQTCRRESANFRIL